MEGVAVHVLDAPEAAGGDGALLSTFGEGLGGGLGVEAGGARGEWAENAAQEGGARGHCEEEACEEGEECEGEWAIQDDGLV